VIIGQSFLSEQWVEYSKRCIKSIQQLGGGATGVTGALASDIGLLPTSFVADTAHTYAYPLVNPETVIDEV